MRGAARRTRDRAARSRRPRCRCAKSTWRHPDIRPRDVGGQVSPRSRLLPSTTTGHQAEQSITRASIKPVAIQSHRKRTPRARRDGSGTQQRGDRRQARLQPEDRAELREHHLREAARRRSGPSDRARAAPRTRNRVTSRTRHHATSAAVHVARVLGVTVAPPTPENKFLYCSGRKVRAMLVFELVVRVSNQGGASQQYVCMIRMCRTRRSVCRMMSCRSSRVSTCRSRGG